MTTIHNQASNIARKFLVNKYRHEYQEVYRAEVRRLGGKPQATKEEKIAMLKNKIKELEAK